MKLFLVTYKTEGEVSRHYIVLSKTKVVLANSPQEAITTLIKYVGVGYSHEHVIEEIKLDEIDITSKNHSRVLC